jgi:prevent-host-death family protein
MPKALKQSDRRVKRAIPTAAQTSGHDWQLQTAKAKFSELFRLARTEGPQRVTRQGREGVVMISDEQYERLVVKSHQPRSIVQFFRESPLVGIDLDFERIKDTGRDAEL